MHFLYGDLTRAKCQENALELLQRVIDMSVDVLKLHQEIDNALLTMQAERNRLTQANEDIEAFRAELVKVIQARVANRPETHVVSTMGQAVTATLVQHANDGKARMQAEIEQAVNAVQTNINQLAEKTIGAMKSFFMGGGIPIKQGTLHCIQDGLAFHADAEILDASGVFCTYKLNTSASEFFSGPKRFGDLVPGRLEVPVGTKKGRFKKEPVPELVRIDDAMLTHVFDGAEVGEYRLSARTGGAVEGIQIRVAKDSSGGIKVFKVANKVLGQQISSELFSGEQLEALTRFWQQLSPHILALYQTKETLASVKIDGNDVMEGRLFAEVVNRLVRYLTPIIRDIDSHTPVDGELSLTIEHDEEGRREVFFIRKNKLVERLRELPEMQRSLFAPLGLDEKLMSGPSPIRPVEPGEASVTVRPKTAPKPVIQEKTVEVSADIIKGVLVEEKDVETVPGVKLPLDTEES
jgi:hypothetical protein